MRAECPLWSEPIAFTSTLPNMLDAISITQETRTISYSLAKPVHPECPSPLREDGVSVMVGANRFQFGSAQHARCDIDQAGTRTISYSLRSKWHLSPYQRLFIRSSTENLFGIYLGVFRSINTFSLSNCNWNPSDTLVINDSGRSTKGNRAHVSHPRHH